jgi:peptidoglycan hydrolase-like amidase
LSRGSIKRILVVLVAIVFITSLTALYSPSTHAADQSIVRVKLSVGSVTQLNFSLNGNYGIKGTGTYLSSGSYSVKAENGALTLYSGSSAVFSGADIFIEEYANAASYNYATLSTTTYGSNDYRGSLQFKLNSGKIDVINHIYIEYYLYGVVPHEMSNAWPLEALKTQAVAARTYAKRYMTGSGSYDVVDTSANQVYKGFNPANTNAIRAVDETAKTVLKCNGELVQTYYSASNVGWVDIPQHVWSSSAPVKPYHVVQADPYDTQNTWSEQEVVIFPKTMAGTGIQYQRMKSGSMVAGTGSEVQMLSGISRCALCLWRRPRGISPRSRTTYR